MQIEEIPFLGRRAPEPEISPPQLWHGFRPVGAPPQGRGPDLRHLACLEGRRATDPVLDAIAREIERSSVLDTVPRWIDELHDSRDNNAPVFQKLMHLFDAGTVPERIAGHCDGVCFGLRTGDEPGWLAPHGNVLNLLWSATVGSAPPWVGKSFSPIEYDELARLTDGYERGDRSTWVGINHFRRIPNAPVSDTFFSLLGPWMRLRPAPPRERALYGHERDGGLFIARRAPSVWPSTRREVLQLNYRWPALDGRPPFAWLIDELVELSEGVYLGQLLFATRRWLSRFDPYRAPEDDHYQHFGHFLLFDDRWAGETRRVFTHLGPGLVSEPAPDPHTPKFTTFTFADPKDGRCDDALLDEITSDLAQRENVLDLLHHYSRQLHGTLDNRSHTFLKLRELFNRGRAPGEMRGYLRGAVISFHTAGYYRLFDVNTLNAAWKLGRLFSPWTGKTFEPIDASRLRELTDGAQPSSVPTCWGSNTLVFRTAGEKVVRQAMRLTRIPVDAVPPAEAQANGYDAKSFYFLAQPGASINDENDGKQVLQLNYRWPRLHTFPPDNYCIDELVQVAEGLYLGQLIYATDLLRAYDPGVDPAAYRYRVFGYFMLMDGEWQRLRLEMGFDPYNV